MTDDATNTPSEDTSAEVAAPADSATEAVQGDAEATETPAAGESATEATTDAADGVTEAAAEATAAGEGAEASGQADEASGAGDASESTSAKAAEDASDDAETLVNHPAPTSQPAEEAPIKHPPTDRPFLVVTALVDSGVKAATATMSHGDAMERALAAAKDVDLDGVDLVELSISPAPFGALRKALSLSDDTVALYDIFPLASHLSPEVKRVAGQFLAAEAVWTLEEQGLLGGVPLNARLDLPGGWERDPKAVHARLVNADALNLSTTGIEAFKAVKTAWDASASAS
ncbi:MAG: hypothetical protein AAF938_13880 [Myxococcota bacterium]